MPTNPEDGQVVIEALTASPVRREVSGFNESESHAISEAREANTRLLERSETGSGIEREYALFGQIFPTEEEERDRADSVARLRNIIPGAQAALVSHYVEHQQLSTESIRDLLTVRGLATLIPELADLD